MLISLLQVPVRSSCLRSSANRLTQHRPFLTSEVCVSLFLLSSSATLCK